MTCLFLPESGLSFSHESNMCNLTSFAGAYVSRLCIPLMSINSCHSCVTSLLRMQGLTFSPGDRSTVDLNKLVEHLNTADSEPAATTCLYDHSRIALSVILQSSMDFDSTHTIYTHNPNELSVRPTAS